jgi:hypothetical protein
LDPSNSISPTTVRHPAELDGERLHGECDIRFQRRSGPGGQHRNKVETAVHLTHRRTGVSAQASERRQQGENLAVALERLRIQLALDERRTWDRPSLLWTRRCGNGKLRVSRQHGDYAALLAEALDVLAQESWQPAAAGAQLACSSSQLVRFLQKEPAALVYVNRQRAAMGKGPLR